MADADARTCAGVLFLVLGADDCTRVLLLVLVQMLVLVLDRVPTE